MDALCLCERLPRVINGVPARVQARRVRLAVLVWTVFILTVFIALCGACSPVQRLSNVSTRSAPPAMQQTRDARVKVDFGAPGDVNLNSDEARFVVDVGT
jgi:hypothetical protein